MATLTRNTLGLGTSPALLIVDASVAFTDPHSPLGADFSDEIAAINQIMAHASQAQWPRFFSTVWYETEREARIFRDKLPSLNLLEAGSPMVQIDPRLILSGDDVVFRKTHASCFFGTDLDEWLQSAGVDSLVVCGFTTSGCVRATAVDALQYNYRSVVVEECVGDRDRDAHTANLHDIDAKYGDVVSLASLELFREFR